MIYYLLGVLTYFAFFNNCAATPDQTMLQVADLAALKVMVASVPFQFVATLVLVVWGLVVAFTDTSRATRWAMWFYALGLLIQNVFFAMSTKG